MRNDKAELLREAEQGLVEALACIKDIQGGMSEAEAIRKHGLAKSKFRRMVFGSSTEISGRKQDIKQKFEMLLSPEEKLYGDVFKCNVLYLPAVPENLTQNTQDAIKEANLSDNETVFLHKQYWGSLTAARIAEESKVSRSYVSKTLQTALDKLRQPQVKMVFIYGQDFFHQCEDIRRKWHENAQKNTDAALAHVNAMLQDAFNKRSIDALDDALEAGFFMRKDLITRGSQPESKPGSAWEQEFTTLLSASGMCELGQGSVSEYKQTLPTSEMGFSNRAKNALDKAGYKTLADFEGVSGVELLNTRHIGRKTAFEICAVLKRFGIDLLAATPSASGNRKLA